MADPLAALRFPDGSLEATEGYEMAAKEAEDRTCPWAESATFVGAGSTAT